MSKELNRLMQEELETAFSSVSACVLVSCKGLASDETFEFRRSLHENGVRLRVVKNSLARRSLEKLGMKEVHGLDAGPTAMAWSDQDPVAPCRVIVEWKRKTRSAKVEIKGGILDGKALTAQQVTELASLPSRKEMLGIVLATVIAPMQQIATLLNNTLCVIPNLVQNHIDKKLGETPSGGDKQA